MIEIERIQEMAELPKIAEEAVKKIDSKLECSICMDKFKEPKLLPCFHIFCKTPCLERLVVRGPEGQTLTCPTCRHLVTLPDNGVVGLQTDFHTEDLFEIRQALEKAKSTQCENCTDSEASKYCQECRSFLCVKCTEIHGAWKKNEGHRLLEMDEIRANVSSVIVPVKQPLKCDKHPEMEAKVYCENCSEMICTDCTIRIHRGHNYDLARDVLPKHKEELIANLNPLRVRLENVERALRVFEARDKAIEDQRATVEADIHREIDQLHQLLDQRRVELVTVLDMHTQQKLKELAAQKDEVETTRAKMSSCLEYAEAGLETGTEGEVLRMKGPVLKRIKEITAENDPDTLAPRTEANVELVTSTLDQLSRGCREFGEVGSNLPSIANTHAVGDGTKFAILDEQTVVEVQPVTSGNEQFKGKVNITAKLYSATTKTTTECDIKQENDHYGVRYKPICRGKHSLSIKMNKHHIQGSPFTIATAVSLVNPRVLPVPDLKMPLKMPYGATINSKGHLVVVEYLGHCVKVLTNDEGKTILTFGSGGDKPGELNKPTGVAVDKDDNIYVADFSNHRIQKFTSDGKFVRLVGSRKGNGNNQFSYPIWIRYNRRNDRLYICNRVNPRIQVFTTDLIYEKTIGGPGQANGCFNRLENLDFDKDNNMFVADYGNKRVQVFTADGKFVRAFPTKTSDDKLIEPYGIAIDSSNIVYIVSEKGHCVHLFTTQGDYIATYGKGQFRTPTRVCVDQEDSIIVCDTSNHRLLVF